MRWQRGLRFKTPWLDRLWLWAIAVSFAIMAPIFVIVQAERYGWVTVALFVLALLLFGMWRGWPTDSPPPSSPAPR